MSLEAMLSKMVLGMSKAACRWQHVDGITADDTVNDYIMPILRITQISQKS